MTEEEKEKLRLEAVAMSLVKGVTITYAIWNCDGYLECVNCGGVMTFDLADGTAICAKCYAIGIYK